MGVVIKDSSLVNRNVKEIWIKDSNNISRKVKQGMIMGNNGIPINFLGVKAYFIENGVEISPYTLVRESYDANNNFYRRNGYIELLHYGSSTPMLCIINPAFDVTNVSSIGIDANMLTGNPNMFTLFVNNSRGPGGGHAVQISGGGEQTIDTSDLTGNVSIGFWSPSPSLTPSQSRIRINSVWRVQDGI